MGLPYPQVRDCYTSTSDGLTRCFAVDGEFFYFAPLSARRLFRIPTSFLKIQPSAVNPNAIILANQAVQDLGDTGSHLNGLESDDQGFIYLTAPGTFSFVLLGSA